MSGRIGKYTYKNESVLKEFLGKLFKALGSNKAKQIRKQLEADPEMKQIIKRMDQRNRDLDKKIAKKRKADPEYDRRMKQMGL
jgi:DNA topoisomerase VI subunit B